LNHSPYVTTAKALAWQGRVFESRAEFCRTFGLHERTVNMRIERGYTGPELAAKRLPGRQSAARRAPGYWKRPRVKLAVYTSFGIYEV
jgi:hypothetical protein